MTEPNYIVFVKLMAAKQACTPVTHREQSYLWQILRLDTVHVKIESLKTNLIADISIAISFVK